MLHAEPFETHLLSAELCILFIYFLKGNCIGLEYHIILSKIHIIVIIKTKIIDQNKSCSNRILYCFPQMIEDNVNRINLLLSGNAIKNIPLIIINEIRGMSCFPMVEAPKKDLCPDSVDISQILDVFCFLDIWIESG